VGEEQGVSPRCVEVVLLDRDRRQDLFDQQRAALPPASVGKLDSDD
jgi:hypothetical protein